MIFNDQQNKEYLENMNQRLKEKQNWAEVGPEIELNCNYGHDIFKSYHKWLLSIQIETIRYLFGSFIIAQGIRSQRACYDMKMAFKFLCKVNKKKLAISLKEWRIFEILKPFQRR